MYPRLLITPENHNPQLMNQFNVPEENKKLCAEICIVFICSLFVCIIYFTFFLHIANDEHLINFTDLD